MRQTLTMLLATVAIVLAVTASGHAQGMSDRRGGDGSHHDGGGHHNGNGDHNGHHQHQDGHHGHHGFRGPFVYWNPYPVYVQPTPGYWYYCPSAQAYYPYVTYCIDSWVPVRVQ